MSKSVSLVGHDMTSRFANSDVGKLLPKATREKFSNNFGMHVETLFASYAYQANVEVQDRHGKWRKSKEFSAEMPFLKKDKEHIHIRDVSIPRFFVFNPS